MIQIAKEFFQNQKVFINSMDDFKKSDLCIYLETLYKTKLTICSTGGFIKVIRHHDGYTLYENVFYDWAGQGTDMYITFANISMRPGFIRNTEAGKQLSEKGYYVFQNTPKDIERTIQPVKLLNFNPEGCDRITEPNAMFKYNPKVWGEVEMNGRIDYEAYSLFKQMEARLTHLTSFSNVLLSLDAYDMICLKWSDGRSILPHNDLDIRMFVNLVSYWDETYEHRYLKVGEYDWYDYLFPIILTDQWEGTNNITAPLVEYDKVLSTRYVSPMVNVFNPRFYHEVTPLKSGRMYSISAHKAFKSIIKNMELVR